MVSNNKWHKGINGSGIKHWRRQESHMELIIGDHTIHIDFSDVPILRGYSWTISGREYTKVVFANKDGKSISLGKLILSRKLGKSYNEIGIAIHADKDWTNYRRANIIEGTYTDAAHKRKIQTNNTSGVKGVSYNKKENAWIVQLNHYGSRTVKRFPVSRYGHHEAFDEAVAYRLRLEATIGI